MKNNMVFILRIIACFLWIVAGILSNSIPGALSAIASVLFIIAMIIDVLDN